MKKGIYSRDHKCWETIKGYKIAPYVSKLKNKDAKCLMTYEDYRKKLDSVGIMSFFKRKPK